MTIKQEILVNVSPRETRVAIIENGVLQELHLQRKSSHAIVGNIFKAKVVRVLPGMQAAFIDLGLDKNGFLHARDVVRADPTRDDHPIPAIETLLREGQIVMVQVVQEARGDKGAKLTTQLSLPSRNLVLLVQGDGIGISQKIESAAQRSRLSHLLQELTAEHQLDGGIIVRTLAESVSDDELQTDVLYLQRLQQNIDATMKKATVPSQIYEDMPLTLRVLRDLMHPATERVFIDSNDAYQQAQKFAKEFMPEAFDKIEFYDDTQPLFSKYTVEQELKNALDRKVMLASGGYLVIDQTEAMTTVDVNSGSYVGRGNDQNTFLKTNLEAATEVARQLRLRNTAGIIIIDFIDMQTAQHKKQVLLALESAIAKDHVRIQISDISPLGLVEITRKRTRESLEQLMCEPCQVCDGHGMVKTIQTVCYEILREVVREDRQFKARAYTIVASSPVIDLLSDQEAKALTNLEDFIQRPITLQVDTLFYQQQYDIVLN